jgi:nucleoside-diphosphate-sugar epimerase
LKVALTGGSGFIGKNISKFLSPFHEVRILDLIDPHLENTHWTQGSVFDLKVLEKFFSDVDVVIHLAAVVGVEKSENYLVNTLDVNIHGTKQVLEAAKNSNVNKIVLSSSSEIYGNASKIPINEESTPKPITTYGISKLAAEEYLKCYSKEYNIDYSIVRLFNVYGNDQRTEFVLPRFVDLAIKNKQIVVHGDGSQIRSFCHIDDICEGFKKITESNFNDTFNIGNNLEPISMKELANKIIKITNSSSQIKFVPFVESGRNRNEIIDRIPDISKIKEKLKFSPKILLTEGIKKMIQVKIN